MVEAILAAAIATWTDATPHEARLLLSIAAHESGFRRDVVQCLVLGDGGRAFGAWQIHPRSPQERRAACALGPAARLALARVRESLAACAHLPAPERLAVFASGSCSNRGGRAASRKRWVK